MKDDPAVRTVAKTIIRCAQQGIRDVVMNFAPRAETKACDPALSYVLRRVGAVPDALDGRKASVGAKTEGRFPLRERILPDEVPPNGAPKPEPNCEKCGGSMEQLTRLPKRFDHPAFDVFRCLDCGGVNWKQVEE
jgi:hypothetical protein